MNRLAAFLRELKSPGNFLAALFLALLVAGALLAPWLAPHSPVAHGNERLISPEADHLLGTDQFGRDIFSRLITGARVDLLVSFGAAALAAVLGVVIGLIGGTTKGFPRMLAMRGIEVILAFPPIVFALLVVTLFGPGSLTLILTMGILFAPQFARVVYGEVLTISNLEYVQASRVMGSSSLRVLFLVILPGALPPVLVQLSMTVATSMLLSSGLSYLGLGVVPPTPSWGGMIAEGQAIMMTSPGLLFFSSAAVVATVLCFSVLADALEKSLDPRRSRKRGAVRQAPKATVA
ncbi:ABC transporter permease [Nesterenkonia sp.]|uniref:ABC transporter permease n=1 Tax=Nesterenkonia sp. TaxID=704201 RepID=UPI002622429A|nr:ABC transporter permease [Nesterenkonia sp.]